MATIYDEILEKITSSTLTTENWEGILTFCDKINSDIDGAKSGLKALRKRLNNRDPHVVLMAISVLDSCWANCENKFRKEVSSSQFINELKALCTNSQRLVAEKMRVTLQKWIDSECKNEPSLSLIVSLHRTLKEDGYSFVVDDPKKTSLAAANAKYANDPNFVSSAQEEEEIAKAIAASLADAEKQEKSKKNGTLYPSTNGNGNVKANSPSQPSPMERKVRALYDFEAAESNELSFVAGDIINVTDESNPHWWTGRLGGRQGLFPSSFVTSQLDEPQSKDFAVSAKAEEVVASINEAVLVRCLNVLHECDPTGERADPQELEQLESASYAQGPLIDAYLASIDKQSNSLAQVDVAIRDVLALYDDAIQKGGYPQNQSMYGPPPVAQQQQSYGYPQQAQQVPYQQYPAPSSQAAPLPPPPTSSSSQHQHQHHQQQYQPPPPPPQYSAQQPIATSSSAVASQQQQLPYYGGQAQIGGAPVAPVPQQWPAQQQY